MLLKPYSGIDDERRNPFTQTYIGVVSDNNDPEKRKRLRILIDPRSYLKDEELPWVKQEGDSATGCSPDESSHHIPEIGSEVSVYFKNNDPNDPVYKGVETTDANKCSLFDEGYPNTYGNKDSAGNYEVTNKETGITVRRYASGTEVRCNSDGEYTIETKSGNYISIDGDGTVHLRGPKILIHATDDIEMRATRIKMVATNGLTMDASNITSRATIGYSVKAGAISMDSRGDVDITAPSTSISNLSAKNGASDVFIDLLGRGTIYDFQDGILTSVSGGVSGS